MALALVSTLLFTLPAFAQSRASDRAAAEALFDQAIKMMQAGQAAEACPKLEESQRLDPGVGTLLYLADCYQQVGRTASAWATFREAAYAARAAGQTDREQIANDYAERLKPKLSYVTFKVAEMDTPGLEIRRDGEVVGRALWSAAIPVDPGNHVFEASAPNKEPWQHEVAVPTEPGQTTVDVPPLQDAARAAAPEPSAGAPATPAAELPASQPSRAGGTLDSGPRGGGSSQATWGWIAAGVGAAGLVTSGIMSLSALSENRQADDECLPNDATRCNELGVEKAESASGQAALATVAGGVGIAGLALGIILIATAPDEPSSAVRVAPSVAKDGAGLSIRGAF